MYSTKTAEAKDNSFFMDMVQTPLFDTTFDLRDGDVITVDQDDTVSSALRTLCDNDILGAPVVNDFGEYVGMVDMMALVNCALNIFTQTWRPDRDSEEYRSKKRRFRRTLVREIVQRRLGRPKSNPIIEDFSMFHALETLCLTGEHRAALVDTDNVVTGLINQSMIVDWMHQHVSSMPSSMREARVIEIRPWSVVSTIAASRRAIDGFRMLKSESVSSLAVVDTNGRITDVISARDLRGMSPDSLTFRFLWNTCDFFKDQVRENYPMAPARPVTITRDATLEEILRLMSDNSVHRLFVVNSSTDKTPVDVISMTDCMRFVLNTIKEE